MSAPEPVAGKEARTESPPWAAHLLHRLESAVAAADPQTWRILYQNQRFIDWFPAGELGDSLARHLPDFNEQRARDRLERRGKYAYEAEVRAGARRLSINVGLRLETAGGQPCILVECRDLTKQKEAEYMLDSYSRMAEKNARELQREKERAEKLLLNVMPRTVYEEMREFGTTTPQRYESASVLMLDFVGFTSMAISRDPSAIVAELNDIFSAFDRIVELFDCERIKTIGDSYVAVSGLPVENQDHATNIARVALRMRRYLKRRNATNPNQWQCRIGVATGPMIGSLVGIQKYVYDIFGPAVNYAARLEAVCEPMQIVVSEDCRNIIRDDFVLEDYGEFDLKGFGPSRLYILQDEAPRHGPEARHF